MVHGAGIHSAGIHGLGCTMLGCTMLAQPGGVGSGRAERLPSSPMGVHVSLLTS